jgi:mannose-6-phosphate isomerase-like protein (cupin superfamily)
VLSGRIKVIFGDHTYTVKAGESFYYRTTKTHRITNTGTRPAKYLWISTPPEF